MGGRPTFVGLIAAVVVVLGVGPVSAPSTATAELRIPGLFGGPKNVKRRRYRAGRPVLPSRNPDRVFAAVSAAAVSPKVADHSEVDVVVGTTASAMVSLALPAPKVKTAAAEPSKSDPAESGAAKAKEVVSEDADAGQTPTDATEGGTEADSAAAANSGEAVGDETPEIEADDSETLSADPGVGEDDSSKTAASENDADEEQGSADADSKPIAEAPTKSASLSDQAAKMADEAKTDEAKTEDDTADGDKAPADVADDVADYEAGDDTGRSDEIETAASDSAGETEPVVSEDNRSEDKASEAKTADVAEAEDTDAQNSEEPEASKQAEDSKQAEESKQAEDSKTPQNTEDTDAARAAAVASSSAAVDEVELEVVAKSNGLADEVEVEVAGASPKAEPEPASKPDPAGKSDDSAEDKSTASGDEAPSDAGDNVVKDVAAQTDEAAKEADASKETDAPKAQATLETDAEPASNDTASEADASDTAKADETETERVASAADDTSAAGKTDSTTEASSPALHAHDATVVLDVSAPPRTETPDPDGTKIAALSPLGVALPDKDAPEAQDENAVDGTPALEVLPPPPPPPPADPIILAVRTKVDGPGAPKLAASDLAALKTVYGDDETKPLWIEDDSLSPKAKTIVATIQDADDWGLDAAAYKLPASDATLSTEEAKADAELALSAAILKYARHAQTGRLTPSKVSKLFDQHPKARDPKVVLGEIAASMTPDKALLATHPQHEQYQRLHSALVLARDSAKTVGRNPDNDRNVQLIVMNMERWRWVPRDLGNYYVWNNVPEYEFRVLKGGQTIYQEKSIVGQYKYATPFFSAPMRNVVFHPNWTVPPTIVKEDIAPKLKGPKRGGLFGSESRNTTLRRYGLAVSYKGKPIDADTVDWNTVNIHKYTFVQDPGPANVLGKFKFNFPNKHAIYMHDTVQKELFSRQTRTLSHGCIRVNQPARFAALLLAEDKGWSMNQVQDTLARNQGQSKVISLNKRVPVHLTYFTAIADEYGSVRDYDDIYGIDNRMAPKLFSNPEYFPVPVASEVSEPARSTRVSQSRRRRSSNRGLDNFISGIFGN